uniref:Uncharacterized protein n=1 Tax=Aegilops tauschii TaxID=37682 RepID=M8CDT0_AEGTA
MADRRKDIYKRQKPAESLTEDLLIEILSRVPYRSLCRSKCVSRRWRGIISHPDNRKVLPQYHLHELAGFLYERHYLARNFARVSAGGRPRIRPSLPFLPGCDHFHLMDSCNGLLLCRRFETPESWEFDYVVCNPATEKWVVLPGFFSMWHTARLGFDPVVSSHFHVFHFLEHEIAGYPDGDDYESDGHVKGVEIYSSETGAWSHKDSVDVEGTTWKVIPIPYNPDAPKDLGGKFIDLSQGLLYLAHTDQYDKYKLSIWVLEDYDSQIWVLKHSVRYMHLFQVKYAHHGSKYDIVALHPQRNMIFFIYGRRKELISYDMDSGKVWSIDDLGHDSVLPYLPYVPLYSEELADWHC